MLDKAGYFYTDEKLVQEHGDPTAVQREIQAQVERALAAGIDVTHLDTYIQVAFQHHIRPFLVRIDEAGLREWGVEAEAATFFAQQLQDFEAQGLPMLDDAHDMPLEQPENRLNQVIQALDALPPGITYLIIRPAQDTPELRALTPDWPARVADYQTFSNEALRAHIQNSGLSVIGWRALRELWD